MWQQFLDIWGSSIHFRIAFAILVVGIYIVILK